MPGTVGGDGRNCERRRLSFDDILTINIPSYFMKDTFAEDCSMLLARSGSTLDGLTYLIKNRDMEMMEHQAAIEYLYPGWKNGSGGKWSWDYYLSGYRIEQ